MGNGLLWIILIVIGVLLIKPDILPSFQSGNETNSTMNKTQTVVQPKDFVGKPIKDDIEFDCRFDSDCSFFNDACNDQCRCDRTEGECYIPI